MKWPKILRIYKVKMQKKMSPRGEGLRTAPLESAPDCLGEKLLYTSLCFLLMYIHKNMIIYFQKEVIQHTPPRLPTIEKYFFLHNPQYTTTIKKIEVNVRYRYLLFYFLYDHYTAQCTVPFKPCPL